MGAKLQTLLCFFVTEAGGWPGGAGEVPCAGGRDRAGRAGLAQDCARPEEGSGGDAESQDHRAAGPRREARGVHVSCRLGVWSVGFA